MVPYREYKYQGQVSCLQQLFSSDSAPNIFLRSLFGSSFSSHQGSTPKRASGSFLAFGAASLMSSPGVWQSCHVWPSAVTAKVTIDDQNWGCPETQLLQGPLICPALEWSRAWHRRLWWSLANEEAKVWPSPSLKPLMPASCPIRVRPQKQASWDRSQPHYSLYLGLCRKSLSRYLAWWCLGLEMQKSNIALPNHPFMDSASIYGALTESAGQSHYMYNQSNQKAYIKLGYLLVVPIWES